MMNWQERYEQLAKLYQNFDQKLRETEQLAYKIKQHIKESDQLNLCDHNKCRLMRLKEDVTIAVEYCGVNAPKQQILYHKGTLIECGVNGHVYLDEDGDGNLYFPTNLLEPVELSQDEIDWSKVVIQG